MYVYMYIDAKAKRMISKGSSTYLKDVTWIIGALDGRHMYNMYV